MRIFYIDYENVSDGGLNGIAKLKEDDRVKIFYSEDAQKMTFGTHRRIIDSKAEFSYLKISPDMKTLKNALDFMILQDVESTMATDKTSEYFIVSKDTDFDGFIGAKSNKKFTIRRITEVCQANVSAPVPEVQKKPEVVAPAPSSTAKTQAGNNSKVDERQKQEQVVRTYINSNLKEYKNKKEHIVSAYMSTTTKQGFHELLQVHFKGEAAKIIYRSFKDLLKDRPGK